MFTWAKQVAVTQSTQVRLTILQGPVSLGKGGKVTLEISYAFHEYPELALFTAKSGKLSTSIKADLFARQNRIYAYLVQVVVNALYNF